VNGQEKNLLAANDQSKFYSGDCYIFQYAYPGEDREEHLIGTWIGNNSVEVKDLYYFIPANSKMDHFIK
jgi:gelsolin